MPSTDPGSDNGWERWKLSYDSYQWWVAEGAIGLFMLVAGAVTLSPLLLSLGALFVITSLFVIRSRWGGLRYKARSSPPKFVEEVEKDSDENDDY